MVGLQGLVIGSPSTQSDDPQWTAGRFAELLAALPVAVYTIDRTGAITSYNERASELWGRAPACGDPQQRFCGSLRLFLPDGTPLPHDRCPMATVLGDGRATRDAEVVIERPDGSRITALVNIVPLRDANGDIAGAVNCFVDITERKLGEEKTRRAEAALRERERRSRELIESLPTPIYTTDADGYVTSYNRAAAEFAGRTPVLGRDRWCVSWRMYRPDGTPLPHDECPMAVALRENRPVRGVEALIERPDGTRVPFMAHPTPLRDEDGRLTGAVNMLIDISDRKRAEGYLQRIASIVESSDDAIISKNLDGIIETWNQGAERIFGYTAEEVIGKPVTILMPEDLVNEEPGILARLRRGERVDHYETVRRRKDGTLIDVSLTVSPVKAPDGTIVGASKISRDITAQKRAEERTKLLAREVDHRAKNMLATVQALTRMTRADSVPAYIEALTGRLRALAQAHTLLAKSRWKSVNLRRLIEEELEPFGTDGDSNLRIAGPDVELSPDSSQGLGMALHELATNAAKYGAFSVPGGSVTVEWDRAGTGVVLRWTERGGPPVREPGRRGFGSGLIEAAVQGQLEGKVTFDWRPAGLACELVISSEKLAPP